MKWVWLALKVLGMLFVILVCMSSLHKMGLVMGITHNFLYVLGYLPIAAALVFWAWRVIWKPISPSA